MKIYNTLDGKKQEFIPLKGKDVNMYACGITVSGEAHIGHTYQAIIYDIIRKFLIKQGYKVTYARNYTDVDDKIIARSKETGIPADRYAEMMIKKIDKVMRDMDIDEPDVWLKATKCMDDIIDFIEKLVEKGFAYPASNGDVYFAVEKFEGYGKLSNRNLEDALNGVRIENQQDKHNPLDFTLWKSAKEGEIAWQSPWGMGRPGWHIECSAMNRSAFGESIDIHGGGRDLIFPHHENEIAQSEALTGKQFVKYWVHNGLIKVNGQKMSKSLGNSLTVEDLLKKYTNEAIKFALLQTNYRNDINITDNLFPDADKHLYEFYKTIADVKAKFQEAGQPCVEIDNAFNEALSDDFNISLALSNLYGYFKTIKQLLANGDNLALSMANQIIQTYSMLGIFKANIAEYVQRYEKLHGDATLPSEVLELKEKLKQAREQKNYAESDAIRETLLQMGYTVQISKDGIKVVKKN